MQLVEYENFSDYRKSNGLFRDFGYSYGYGKHYGNSNGNGYGSALGYGYIEGDGCWIRHSEYEPENKIKSHLEVLCS
jgi:hypothetical protein